MNSTTYTPGQIVFYMYNFNSCFPVFYKVTKITAKSIYIVEIGKSYGNIAPGFSSYDCAPDPDRITGRERRVLVQPDGYGYINYYGYRFALEAWKGSPISGYSD